MVEDLTDDQLGQPARLEAMIPFCTHGELVRDEPAERARVELLGVPGGQPHARPIASSARPAARPVSLVDHRVPPDRVAGPPAADGPLHRPHTDPRHKEARDRAEIPQCRGRWADGAYGTRVQH